MNGKTILAGLAGGVINWVLGGLFYMVVLGSYFAVNHGEGVAKNPPEMMHIAMGCLTYGVMIAVIFHKWAGIKTLSAGLKAGATLGLLFGLALNFWRLGDSYYFASFTPAMVDTVVQTIMSSGTGAVVGWVLGRGES